MIIDNNDAEFYYQIKTHHNTVCYVDLIDKKIKHAIISKSNLFLITDTKGIGFLFLPAENLYVCNISSKGDIILSPKGIPFEIIQKESKFAIKINNEYLSAVWDGNISLKGHCLDWELLSFYKDNFRYDYLKNDLINILRFQEKSICTIMTCFSTYVFINLDGYLVHGGLVIDDSLYVVYGFVYTLYSMLYIKKGNTILYLKDIDENGKVLLSISPQMFPYELNPDETISFSRGYKYLSAQPQGTFVFKNKDDRCDFHLKHILNENSETDYGFDFKDNGNTLLLKNKVLSIPDTLRRIIDCKLSVARFGDGEMRWLLMRGASPKNYQKHDVRLAKMLMDTIKIKSDKLLLCINNLHPEPVNEYWKEIYKFRYEFFRILPQDYTFGNTNISRDINSSTLTLWKQIFQDRNICLVEGEYSRLGVGNDLFSSVASIERILAPAVDAFSKFDKILDFVSSRISKDRLVLLALGPTATVLAAALSQIGYQAIDIGHIDVCYEWHLRGKKTKVKGKYVYEAGGMDADEFPSEEEKNKYLSQIIKKICE